MLIDQIHVCQQVNDADKKISPVPENVEAKPIIDF